MAEIRCSRCGSPGPALDRPPLPGAVGREVMDAVCRTCWQLWLREQVKRINERRLLPADPEHYEILLREMRQYLGLAGDPTAGAP